MVSLTTMLLILYVGLSIMSAIVMVLKRSDIDSNKDDSKNYPFKPYTLAIIVGVISILFFIKSNIIMGIITTISTIFDIKRKH